MGPRQCQVCNEALSKYKCPSCLVPYCSLACFKKHKETPCTKPVPSQVKLAMEPLIPEERACYVDDRSGVLQKSQLESIASSCEIRDALKDEDLRKLIYKIDSSRDAEKELDSAMGVEVFRIFTDKILSAVNP